MNRAKPEMRSHAIRDNLLQPRLIVFSLAGVFFFFFALDRGGTNVFIWACGVFVAIQMVYGNYRLAHIPLNLRGLFAVAAVLVTMSFVFSYQQTAVDRIVRVGKMLIIVFAVHFTGRTDAAKNAYGLFGVLMAVCITWQFLARVVFGLPYGTWSNPHYLANFSILTLPLVFFYFATLPKPYRWLSLPLFAMDIDPVFRNASRPAFLALVVSTLLVLIFFTRSRYRWIGLLSICIGLLLLVVTNYAGFYDKLTELAVSVSNEERVHIWQYAVKMLRDSSAAAWLVGNGIGSSAAVLPTYAISDPIYKDFNFPHNFVIQILFDNGIIGTLLVFGGLAWVFHLFTKLSNSAVGSPVHLFINCMLAVFLNWLIFTGLTVGFYSKYALYPLGFIIGTLFVLAEEARNGA
jgi:O-antigen ligase